MKLTKDTPRLEETVAFHNGVTQWTICNIMKEFTAAKCADVIVKFIDVAMVSMSVCLSICLYVSVLLYVYYCQQEFIIYIRRESVQRSMCSVQTYCVK